MQRLQKALLQQAPAPAQARADTRRQAARALGHGALPPLQNSTMADGMASLPPPLRVQTPAQRMAVQVQQVRAYKPDTAVAARWQAQAADTVAATVPAAQEYSFQAPAQWSVQAYGHLAQSASPPAVAGSRTPVPEQARTASRLQQAQHGPAQPSLRQQQRLPVQSRNDHATADRIHHTHPA